MRYTGDSIPNIIHSALDLSTTLIPFKNSLIIHKEIKKSHQRIGSRAYTFKPVIHCQSN